MTGPDSETESPGTRPISVAELLARNGTIGAPAVTRRRRRRRGDHDAVTVAELTGEIPVVRDDGRDRTPPEANGTLAVAEPGPPAAPEAAQAAPASPETEDRPKTAYWSEPEPRWPTSPQPHHASGPERSAYPRPLPHPDAGQDELAAKAGAEGMSPDPVDHYADVEVMDSDVREAEPGTDDSAYARSDLADSDATLFGGQTLADEMARRRGASNAESPALAEADEEAGDEGAAEAQVDIEASPVDAGRRVVGVRDRLRALWRASVVVFQSVLAVVFGAGLFVAFDQLWRWNSIVALVLSVLVILGLVAGVRVVRKTEDIASTLIAVAVGALITLGPLALSLQSG